MLTNSDKNATTAAPAVIFSAATIIYKQNRPETRSHHYLSPKTITHPGHLYPSFPPETTGYRRDPSKSSFLAFFSY